MATLAKASAGLLERCVGSLGELPKYTFLRAPEIGLTMVRGRVGGTGQLFNLGEMTLTRCVVRLEDLVGFAYVGGRAPRHAEQAAVCDALLQHPQWRDRVISQVIYPLSAEYKQQQHLQASQTAATQVDFLTMVRGE